MKVEKEQMIIRELARNSKQSDREISMKAGVSQPTVSRIRSKLEETHILGYTIIPVLKNLGYEIIAITFTTEASSAQALRSGRVLFASHGIGLRKCFVVVSVHKTFSDYMQFIRSLGGPESFTISTENDIVKHLSFASII